MDPATAAACDAYARDWAAQFLPLTDESADQLAGLLCEFWAKEEGEVVADAS